MAGLCWWVLLEDLTLKTALVRLVLWDTGLSVRLLPLFHLGALVQGLAALRSVPGRQERVSQGLVLGTGVQVRSGAPGLAGAGALE